MAASSRPVLHRISLSQPDEDRRDAFPFDVPALRTFSELAVTSRVLCFVGENGTGKSTLLEAIAIASGLNPEGGSRDTRFATRDEASGVHELADRLALARTARHRDGFFLRAESLFTFSTYLEATDPAARAYGGRSLHSRSHGEAFLALFVHRLGPGGLYLFDEPEAALSPARQLALLVRMHDLLLADTRTQFIIATHAPIILAYPGSQIMSFDDGMIRPVTYRETSAFRILHRFLNAPESMLDELFREDPS